MLVNGKHYRTVWMEGGVVRMIHQPFIPHQFEITNLNTHKDTARSIKTMIVRGAGAIGATAGYGIAQAALEAPDAARGTVHRFLASNCGAKLWTSAAHHNRTRGIAAVKRAAAVSATQGECYAITRGKASAAHCALRGLADHKTLAFFTRTAASGKTSDNRVRGCYKVLESLSYVPRLPPAALHKKAAREQ